MKWMGWFALLAVLVIALVFGCGDEHSDLGTNPRPTVDPVPCEPETVYIHVDDDARKHGR
jgi:entry exclusion lipoprotein TrbK